MNFDSKLIEELKQAVDNVIFRDDGTLEVYITDWEYVDPYVIRDNRQLKDFLKEIKMDNSDIFASSDRKPLRVCEYCLQGIENHEGRQRYKTIYVDEEDEIESKCDWCDESGNDTLYEIAPERKRKSVKGNEDMRKIVKYPKSHIKATKTDVNPLSDMNRDPILEFPNGEYVYIEYADGKLYAGGATNMGIIHEYEFDYDPDLSVDVNIQNFYDHIIETNPELMDDVTSAKRVRRKSISAAQRSRKDLARWAEDISDDLEAIIGAIGNLPMPEDYLDESEVADIDRVRDILSDIAIHWYNDTERNF